MHDKHSKPKTMRCIEITEHGGPDVLVMGERPLPVLNNGHVLIKVTAAGVNRPDVVQRLGQYPPPPGASDIPGLEVSGTVIEKSKDVKRWQLGEPVCALVTGGGYAEYVTAPETTCLPVPASLKLIEAAALPETFFTVWHNLFQRAKLRAGEAVLIHGGSSGIGTAAIQIAKALGARIAVTAGSASKCIACLELGADLAINYRTQDFVDEIKANGAFKGVNVILDMVGGDYVAANLKCLKTDGRLVNIAFLEGSKVTLDLMPIMLKRLIVTGSTLRPQSLESKRSIAHELEEKVWPHVRDGTIKPVIYKLFPLDQASEAHKLMESGKHIGKILLTLQT